MLVHEVLSRNLRDRRAVARYAGLTGTPDESGSKRREKGISKAGNPRVRRGLIQLAWRFLMFQPDAALVRWYRERTAGGKGAIRKTMIVALARKLLIALWSYATAGVMPEGVVLKAVVMLPSPTTHRRLRSTADRQARWTLPSEVGDAPKPPYGPQAEKKNGPTLPGASHPMRMTHHGLRPRAGPNTRLLDRGPAAVPRTRELRLGMADPPSWPVSPAQPSKRDTGVGGPQGRWAPPSAVALRAILDLRPPPCPATIMVGTWRNRGGDGSLP